jgi:drug/metabolite transporter (DMT)-like permease
MKKFLENLPPHKKGLLYISFTAFLWSSSGLFIKILTLNAYQISFYRSGIAALTIFAITYFRRKKPKFETDIISNLCAVSYAGILILFVLATKMTTAANAIFLQFTAPIYLLFLEPLFLKTKFKVRDLLTIVICITGMVLFFFGRLEIGNIYGNLLAIASGICFAFFSLFLKWKKQLHKSDNTVNNIIAGNLLISFVCFFLVYDSLAIDFTQALILLYMGSIQIGLSYLIFNEGIKYASATESMIIAMLEAIFNPIWVFLGIGEAPSVFSIIGGVIIFAAILLHTFTSAKRNKMPLGE